MRHFALVLFGICAGPVAAIGAGPVSFSRDVRPILVKNCQGCHQPAKAQGDYRLTTYQALLVPGETGKPPVVPGDPAASYVIQEVVVTEGHAEMPKGRDPLAQAEIDTLTRWVAEGAKDDTPATLELPAIDADRPPEYAALPVVTSLAYSPDGSTLAVSGYHEVLLHPTTGDGEVRRLIGLSERVQSLAFSPDGTRLAVVGGNPGRLGELQVWDVKTGRLRLSLSVTADTLYGVSWSPDGERIAFGAADNAVRAVNATTGAQVLFMGTHSDWVIDTVFSQDGLHLASVSRDMSLKLTEVATQRFIDNVTSITPGALKGGLLAVDRRPLKDQTTAKPSPDMPNAPPRVYDELLCGGSDGVVRLYKMHREAKRVIGDDANRLKEFAAMPGRVFDLRFDGSGSRFAAASSLDGQGEVRVTEVESGKHVRAEFPKSAVYAVAWHPTNKDTVAAAGFDGMVHLIDATTGQVAKSFPSVPFAKTR